MTYSFPPVEDEPLEISPAESRQIQEQASRDADRFIEARLEQDFPDRPLNLIEQQIVQRRRDQGRPFDADLGAFTAGRGSTASRRTLDRSLADSDRFIEARLEQDFPNRPLNRAEKRIIQRRRDQGRPFDADLGPRETDTGAVRLLGSGRSRQRRRGGDGGDGGGGGGGGGGGKRKKTGGCSGKQPRDSRGRFDGC